MRLIDADELCRKLNSGGGESEKIQISPDMPVKAIIDMTLAAYRKCLFAEIEKMPAAYDLDKIVEQLRGLNENEFTYARVMHIVKAGGVNE